jgi:DNA-binding beta-propeller fold protein YncE
MNGLPKTRFLGLIALVCFSLVNGFAHADLLYVANNGNNTVDVINPSGQASVFASTGLSGPGGLAFDSSGNLYVGNFNNNTIEKFNPTGQGTLFANSLMNGPAGMAFDTNGNLYVGSLNSSGAPFGGSIAKFNSTGSGAVFTDSTAPGSPLRVPYDIAINNSGVVYVANLDGQNILEYGQLGVVSIFASGFTQPTGMAFDKSGNLYVSVWGDPDLGSPLSYTTNGVIMKFDSSGNGTVFASGLNGPTGLAFDSAGNLYAAIVGDNTIEKFDSSGNGTVFASGLDAPVFIAFQVPEPAAWILVVLGVGVILANRRSRRYFL